jgi:hypothetical protein
MTSLINFITISFNIRKKCNIGSPRFPIVPIAIPNAQQNVIKPVLYKQKSFVKKKMKDYFEPKKLVPAT